MVTIEGLGNASSSGAIDVEADVPSVFAARTHPLAPDNAERI